MSPYVLTCWIKSDEKIRIIESSLIAPCTAWMNTVTDTPSTSVAIINNLMLYLQANLGRGLGPYTTSSMLSFMCAPRKKAQITVLDKGWANVSYEETYNKYFRLCGSQGLHCS